MGRLHVTVRNGDVLEIGEDVTVTFEQNAFRDRLELRIDADEQKYPVSLRRNLAQRPDRRGRGRQPDRS